MKYYLYPGVGGACRYLVGYEGPLGHWDYDELVAKHYTIVDDHKSTPPWVPEPASCPKCGKTVTRMYALSEQDQVRYAYYEKTGRYHQCAVKLSCPNCKRPVTVARMYRDGVKILDYYVELDGSRHHDCYEEKLHERKRSTLDDIEKARNHYHETLASYAQSLDGDHQKRQFLLDARNPDIRSVDVTISNCTYSVNGSRMVGDLLFKLDVTNVEKQIHPKPTDR